MSQRFKPKKTAQIEFICPECKTIERIPRKIVEFLDEEDQYGVDTSVPPRFDCQNCPGKMVPKFYVGINGKIYSYNDEN